MLLLIIFITFELKNVVQLDPLMIQTLFWTLVYWM